MATSIDWGTKVITVLQADLIQIQTLPIEIYEMNVDTLHKELRALEGSELGIPHLDAHNYKGPITLSGVTYARLVEIINDYTITFLPDSPWVVNVVGGNSNVGDVVNPNNVSVQTSNSAGLQDAESLQAASFFGTITVDPTNGIAGTAFPIGTAQTPVSNLVDAHTIGHDRGIFDLTLKESITIDQDFAEGWTLQGDNISTVATISASADLSNSTLRNLQVVGDTTGGSQYLRFERCLIGTLTAHGEFDYCGFAGTLTLNTAATNFTALVNCFSLVAGGGPTQTPTIDFDGGDHDVVVRGWTGGLTVLNQTSALNDISMDFVSGQLVVGATNTGGTLTLRGICSLTDTSTMTVNDDTVEADVAFLMKLLRNRREQDPADGSVTVYDDDSATVLVAGVAYEDIAGTQTYQGNGADRIDRLT